MSTFQSSLSDLRALTLINDYKGCQGFFLDFLHLDDENSYFMNRIEYFCGSIRSSVRYDVSSCYGCRMIFRRSVMSGMTTTGMTTSYDRHFCSRQFLKYLSRVAKCVSCRFDRCILVGMNVMAIKLPETINADKIAAELAEKRRLLQTNYKDDKQISLKLRFYLLSLG
uniref:Nuclear receptor domain-containing protein n=1 Tax=Ditylenchus dipsaci TaxID=166011 RepID=A0A915CXT7_9BILA